jgi:hypothetical protein
MSSQNYKKFAMYPSPFVLQKYKNDLKIVLIRQKYSYKFENKKNNIYIYIYIYILKKAKRGRLVVQQPCDPLFDKLKREITNINSKTNL